MVSYGWSPFASEYDPVRCGSIDGTDVVPHDRGIVRAAAATYRPNKGVIGDPACTLFVGRLNKNTSEEAVEAKFSTLAPLRRVRLVRDVVTGFSRGYAFVEFYDERTTKTVCREAAGMELDDRELLVEMECERTLQGWVPRRLGGGFGGRKESGQLRFGGRDRPFRKPIFVPPPNRSNNPGDREQTQNMGYVSRKLQSEDRSDCDDKGHRFESSPAAATDSRKRHRSREREREDESYRSRHGSRSRSQLGSDNESKERRYHNR